MFRRFKNAIIAAAENKWEIGILTAISLFAGQTIAYLIYVAGRLFGLFEW